MKPAPSPHLFDELEHDDTLSSRLISEAFDDEGDPTETYAGLAARVRFESTDW